MIDIEKSKILMFDVVAAIREVHKELRAGLNEYCYQEGLQMEMIERDISFVREFSFHPVYHGKRMQAEYRVDFLCKNEIVVECKAIAELTGTHRAQLFNYMRLLRASCGILVNFAPKYVKIERYLYDADENAIFGMNGERFLF